MQMGVFLPVMRTHSNSDITPHFPWLYGADAENAIRKALELRYRLIPYYYSLAHEAWSTGAPLMRPLVMEFPDDPKVADLADQWLMGRGLMAAPVLAERGERKVYFPDDMFTFEGTQTFKRGEEIDVTARLDEIPVYVRAGTIVPLGPIIQDTDQLPGGPLEVQVYPGRDASFTLVEDDGVSYDYQRGIVRKTNFKWNDAMRTLSWKQEGDYHGKEVFTAMRVVVFDTTGKKEKSEALGVFGNISFKN
jgi:alpha-glucosidase